MIAATSSWDSANRLYARSADNQGQQNSVRRRDADGDAAGQLFKAISAGQDSQSQAGFTSSVAHLRRQAAWARAAPAGAASSVLGGSAAQASELLGELIKMIGSYERQSSGTATATGYSVTA